MAGESIAVAIYKLGMENQQYIAAAQQAARASDQLVASQERVAVSEEKVGAASTLAANALQRKLERNDAAMRAQRQYAEAVAFAAKAEEQQIGTSQQRALYLDQEADKLRRTTDALAAKAKAERDSAQAAHDAEQAAKNLARIEGEHALALKNTAAALGVDQAALIAAANAGNRHAAATLDMMNKIVSLNKSLQEGKLNLAAHAQEIDRVQQAYRGNVTAIATQEAAMRKSNTVTGLARHEMINLSRQIQDIGVSLAGGQNPFRILIEQGSQIADIFASSKATLKDFASSVGAALGRLGGGAILGGLVAGIAAIGGTIVGAAISFATAQRDIQQSLLGIGRAAGVTTKDIQGIAEAATSTWGASISEAREFAAALAQSGTLGNASIRDLTLVSKELAQVLGTDVAGAGKQLQQVFTDPVAGLQRLDKEMGTFDRGVAHNVETLMAQGKVFQAAEVAAAALRDRMKELGPEIQRTTSFWTAFGNTVSNVWDFIGKAAARRFGFGLSIEEELERAERALNDANQFFQQTGLGREMVEEAVANFNRLTKILETMGKTAEDIRRSRDVGAAKGMVQNIIPDIANMQKLKNEAEGLKSTLERLGTDSKFADELKQAGIAANNVALALNRVQGASASYLTVASRLTAEYNLQLQSITARTSSEREALAGKQREIALAGQALTAEERRLEITRAMSLEVERQAQTHKDNMAALEDQLNIAKARTQTEELSAQMEADINSRLREGATMMQASEEAAMRRKIAEEGIAKQREANHRREKAALEAEEQQYLRRNRQLRELLSLEYQISTGIGTGAFGALTDSDIAFLRQKGGVGEPGGLAANKFQGIPFAGYGVSAAGVAPLFQVNPATYGRGGGGGSSITSASGRVYTMDDWGRAVEKGFATFEQLIAFEEQALTASKAAAEAQEQAAAASREAAKAQIEAAKAAREAAISKLDEDVKDVIATKLLAGQSVQAVNMLIEQGDIRFGTAGTRFQTQLDLYKRAGASNAQIAADIRAGIIGEGAKPSEILAALDSLTEAVNANTDAQLGLSPFYTSQGDRQLGYRGYTVQKGASNIPGAGTGGLNTGGTGGIPGSGATNPYAPGMGGGITGGVANPLDTVALASQPATQMRVVNGVPQVGYYKPTGEWVTSGIQPQLQPSGYYTYNNPITGFKSSWAASLFAGYTGPFGAGGFGTRMAEGGIVDRPTMAMFGEAGPEAFVPLKGGAIPVRLTGNNDNKPTTVININAPLVHFAAEPTRDEVRESAFQASQMLRRQMAG